jgi:peptide-methionine (S)-S-oxide reductase
MRWSLIALTLAVTACSAPATGQPTSQPATTATSQLGAPPAGQAIATFAGGCFWCMEKPFEQLDGVKSVTSGYTGGPEANPSYQQVSAGVTGHTEAIRIVYDPARITYARLVEVFWHNIDPTQANGQFCDRGTQYRTGIFVHDAAQRATAEASRAKLAGAKLPGPVITQISPAGPFFAAETYHQDYYKKNPSQYQRYRMGCGRDQRLQTLWGPSAGH